jgi:hypothetical protein
MPKKQPKPRGEPENVWKMPAWGHKKTSGPPTPKTTSPPKPKRIKGDPRIT